MSEQSSTTVNTTQSVPTLADAATESSINHNTISVSNNKREPDGSTPSNPCILCQKEEKRLACIPCGHLATCVPCGQSLRACPICSREIEAFVRIYI